MTSASPRRRARISTSGPGPAGSARRSTPSSLLPRRAGGTWPATTMPRTRPTATSGSPRPEDAEYVVSITDHLKKGGPDYFYRLEVTSDVPLITLSVGEE